MIERAGDPLGSRQRDELLAKAAITIEAVTETQARIAREAIATSARAAVIEPA